MKACGEEVNIALICPHCPDGEPFTDQEALRKHIKWDHEQQYLLHGAELVGIDNLKKKLDHELQHVLNVRREWPVRKANWRTPQAAQRGPLSGKRRNGKTSLCRCQRTPKEVIRRN